MIKKLIWKFKYAIHMDKRTRCGFSFGWYNAGVMVDEYDDWKDESPEDMADEEISCWDPE